MIIHIRRLAAIVSSLLLCGHSYAQIDLSGGIHVGYPYLLAGNKAITAGQLSYGLHAGIAYRPADIQFYPSVDIAYGAIRLPLHQAGRHVAAINSKYVSAMINEHFAADMRQGELFFSGGIGLSYLLRQRIGPSGGGNTVVAAIDSAADISKVFPAMHIGIAYSPGNSDDKRFYITMGITMQCMIMPGGRNTYYLNVTEDGNKTNHYQASLTGTMINPVVSVSVHYHSTKK